MKKTDNQKKLKYALKNLDVLEKSVKELYESNKTSFSRTKKLKKEFDDFYLIIEDARQRLLNPTLSIAMVGTTSSGKSTIVNAFNARRVAPMEAQEMSAGILRLFHSDKIQMHVEETKGAKWPSGQYECGSDDEIYKAISDIYDKYRRFIEFAEAPVINVSGPLQWQSNRSILDLPEGLSVEFFDLPGLKTLEDNKNLAVIQSKLQKSFCIVATNYDDVDQTKIERLLEEVSDIVKSRGKADFMLFILNKVDHANADDKTVDDRINTLKKAIAEKINVSSKSITILPFVGRLLYSIQVAIKKDEKQNIIGVDKEKLKNLFKDCGNVFSQNMDSLSNEEKSLFSRIFNDVCLWNKDVSIEDLNAFEKMCYRLSKAEDIFEEIRKRIAESFTEVIILPILSELIQHFEKLLEELDYYVSVRKKTSKLDLIAEEIKVMRMNFFLRGSKEEESYTNLLGFVDGTFQDLSNLNVSDNDKIRKNRMINKLTDFKQEIEKRPLGYIDTQIGEIEKSANKIAEALKQVESADKALSVLKENKNERTISVFEPVSKIPKEIKDRLNIEVLTPFKDYIRDKKTNGEFIEYMGKIISNTLANDMGSMYENVYSLFYSTFNQEGFSKSGNYYTKTSRTELSDIKRSQIVKIYDFSDIRMRDILSKRTNYCFQIESEGFKKILMQYLQVEFASILGKLKEEIAIEGSNLDKMMDKALSTKTMEIVLPDRLFEFTRPEYILVKGTGEEQVYQYTEYHSCKEDRPVYETVTFNTYNYKYENESGLYNRWIGGIQNSMSEFWNIITSWMIDCINKYMTNVKNSSEEVREMAMSIIEEKHRADAEVLRNNEQTNEELMNQINSIKMLKSNFIQQ